MNGSVIDTVGHYNPTDEGKTLVINKESIEKWISQGAQPSNTVSKLLNREGFNLKVVQNAPRKPRKAPAEAAPAAGPALAENTEASEEPAEVAETPVEATTEEPVVAEEAPVEVPAEEATPEQETVAEAEAAPAPESETPQE